MNAEAKNRWGLGNMAGGHQLPKVAGAGGGDLGFRQPNRGTIFDRTFTNNRAIEYKPPQPGSLFNKSLLLRTPTGGTNSLKKSKVVSMIENSDTQHHGIRYKLTCPGCSGKLEVFL